MQTIIFLSGYAEAGKTTSIKILNSLEIPSYSSSALLHEFAQIIYFIIMGIKLDTHNKNNSVVCYNPFGSTIRINRLIMRDFLITIAEKALVKVFTRNIFAAAIKNKLDSYSPVVVIETIGGEEYECFLKEFEDAKKYQIFNLNIRSFDEKKGVDIRKLLPNSYDLWNNKDTEDELKKTILEFLNSIKP
jgi:hypothetical protein